MSSRVAIIGGGLGGCLTALELARRGIPSDVYERNPQELSEASLYNEGKVHLGFIYAHDFSGATGRLMIEGAIHFRRIVMELTGFDVAEALSTPFLYAVHRDSLLSPEQFESHLAACSDEFGRLMASASSNSGYVNGSTEVGFERLATSAWSDDLDPDAFSAVFRTDELGVDPRRLTQEVSRAVRCNQLISLHTNAKVESIHADPLGRWILMGPEEEPWQSVDYDLVLNCSWSDLLRLDEQVQVPLPAEWSYRYKLGNRVSRSVSVDDVSSVTIVLGAFGDIVNYGADGGIFLSWYPSGRLLMTDELDLPDWNGPDFREQRLAAYEDSRRVLESLSNKLKRLDLATSDVDARGGMILATGRSDVDDPLSLLHSRVSVGLVQRDSYFSLNTGKYTLAPLMAHRTADAIERHLSSL